MFFEINLYSGLLLVGFIQAFFFAGLAQRRWQREGRRSDHYLAWVLLLSAVYISQYMLGFGGWYDSHDGRTVFMFYFPFHLLVFLGPMLWFYFRSLTDTAFRIQRRHLPHFIPGLLVLLIYLVCFIWDVVLARGVIGQPFPFHFETKGRLADWRQDMVPALEIGLLFSIGYIILILREYRRYQRYLNAHFSETERLRFVWLRTLLLIVVLAIGMNVLLFVFNELYAFNYKQFWLSHFTIAVMAYLIAVFGYTSTAGPLPERAFKPNMPEPESATPPAIDQLAWKQRLLEYMEKERPYLEPQLSLSDLALKLQTNTSILSKVINTVFEQNFNDFINRYRVLEVEKQLAAGAGQHYTLMAVALESGFNSKATFNRAFRKFTGMAPGEYLRKQGSNRDLR